MSRFFRFFYVLAVSAGFALATFAEGEGGTASSLSKLGDASDGGTVSLPDAQPGGVHPTGTVATSEKKATSKTKTSAASAPKKIKRVVESDADHRFRKDLVLRLNEIIRKTQENSPVLAAELTEDVKLKVLKVFTAALSEGLEYVPATELKKTISRKRPEDEPSYRESIIIATGKVVYLRINEFDAAALRGLRSDAANLAEMAAKPLGLILDLRSSGGGDYGVVAKAVSLFIGGYAEKLKSVSESAFLKLPVIMLVDSDTSGAAEVFAAALLKAGRGVCLGEATAGAPFEKRRIMLANGDYLLIPVIPKRFKSFPRTKLKPDISCPARPIVAYEELKSGGKGETADKCVDRAVDLLVCLNAISTKK